MWVYVPMCSLIYLFNKYFFFFFLAMPCGMRDLSSPTGIEPVTPAVEARSPNHWTARGVPIQQILN